MEDLIQKVERKLDAMKDTLFEKFGEYLKKMPPDMNFVEQGEFLSSGLLNGTEWSDMERMCEDGCLFIGTQSRIYFGMMKWLYENGKRYFGENGYFDLLNLSDSEANWISLNFPKYARKHGIRYRSIG